MLRSDWLPLACLLRELQTLLCEFDRFLEIAEFLVADANVAVRPALAVLVACENESFQQINKCCDLIGRDSPVCCAISKCFCSYSIAS